MNTATIIDIARTFETLFGYLPAHVPQTPKPTGQDNPFHVQQARTKKTTTLKGSPLYGLKDTMGREVFCPITITAGGKDYDFPYAIIGMKNRKILKVTPMVERDGQVIEEIGVGGWQIDVKGFLIDDYGEFPDEQLDMLNRLYNYKEPVLLKSPLTDLFLESSDSVVMSELDIPVKAKVIGVRDFSFTLLQDAILDLYVVN